MNLHQQKPPLSLGLISVFIFVSALLLVLGILFINSQKRHLLDDKKNELVTVANLKVDQISRWRQEKLSDANLIHDNLSLGGLIYNFSNRTENSLPRQKLIKWMNSIIKNFDYLSVNIVDTIGRVRLSIPPEDSIIGPMLRPLIPLALDSQKIILTDLHRISLKSFVHIDLLIPVDRLNRGDSSISGLIILRIDPEKMLYPLLKTWPASGKTSETLLLRRDGDSIIYLNDLKYLSDPALSFRRSIYDKKLIGARAALGLEGISEGIDYRNVEVIAVAKKIPDSPWVMVSKEDKAEIDSTFNEQLLTAKLLILFFISAFGAMIGWMIWHQRVRYYRNKYEAELDRLAVRKHFDYILKYANDIILLIDQDLNIIEVNDRAIEIYKYSRNELIGMNIMSLRLPESGQQLDEQIKILKETSYSRYETIHVCKDGTNFPIEISARLVEIEGIKYYQAIGRDITERRIIEKSLTQLLERYNLATNSAKLAVWDYDIGNDRLIWDDKVYELFGVERNELPPVYDSWLKIVHPEDKEKADSEIGKTIRGESEYNTEFRVIHPDGSVKYIKAFGQVVRDENGTPIRMIGINYDITDQSIAENLLKEREYWLTESQRVGKIGSYVLDIASNSWTSSVVLNEIFGITPESPKTLETWSMLVHPSQRDEMLRYFLNNVIGEKKPFDKEYRIIKNNSSEDCWVWGRGELSFDMEGNPVKMFGTIQDITDRKISEILIIESEERFRKIFEESPISTAMTANNFSILRVNATFCEMLGYSESEVTNLTFRNFTHPDQIPTDELALNELIEGKIPIYKTEKRYIRKDKTIIWGSTTVSAIKDRKGDVQYCLVMIEDITQRKEAEIQVEKSKSLLLATLESTADGILVVDLNGKIVQFNKKFAEMWKIPEAVLISRDDEKALSFVRDQLKDPDSFVNNVRHLYENAESVSFDLLEFNDGRIFERYSQPQRISNEIIGRVWSFRDITQRKIAEDQLIRAKERAEESDRLKTAFLHNISHEIRTPMNAIVGFTTLLDDPDLKNETRKQYIDIIYQSSNQLLSIITDIVDISNIETGQTKVSINEVNINALIRSLYDQFNIRAKQQGLNFNCIMSLGDKEALMETDETKLIQILTNLINNALKFTKSGNIEFGYSIKDDFVEFMVSDTGIGISKDNQSKIFERFYQVESSITRQYGGTGLGLSICRAYAKLLKGEIIVESKPGSGSIFYLTLPFKSSQKGKEEKKTDKKTDGSFDGKTILIAEDDDINFLMVKKSLEPFNLILIRAVNGKEAVEICRSDNEINLVLLDLKMPVMDGLDAMKLINQFRPDLAFVAVTAYAFESDKKNALEQGCKDYLSKPYSKKDLIDILKKYL